MYVMFSFIHSTSCHPFLVGSVIAIELCGTDLAPRIRSLVTSSGWQDQMHIDTDTSMINHVFEPVAV